MGNSNNYKYSNSNLQQYQFQNFNRQHWVQATYNNTLFPNVNPYRIKMLMNIHYNNNNNNNYSNNGNRQKDSNNLGLFQDSLNNQHQQQLNRNTNMSNNQAFVVQEYIVRFIGDQDYTQYVKDLQWRKNHNRFNQYKNTNQKLKIKQNQMKVNNNSIQLKQKSKRSVGKSHYSRNKNLNINKNTTITNLQNIYQSLPPLQKQAFEKKQKTHSFQSYKKSPTNANMVENPNSRLSFDTYHHHLNIQNMNRSKQGQYRSIQKRKQKRYQKQKSRLYQNQDQYSPQLLGQWQNQYQNQFEQASEQEFIYPIQYFIDTSQNQFCTVVYSALVYIQKVQVRLKDINDIPISDSLYMLYACLNGFQKLYQKVGAFLIQQDMIFIDSKGKIKVWMNPNLSKNYPLQILFPIMDNISSRNFDGSTNGSTNFKHPYNSTYISQQNLQKSSINNNNINQTKTNNSLKKDTSILLSPNINYSQNRDEQDNYQQNNNNSHLESQNQENYQETIKPSNIQQKNYNQNQTINNNNNNNKNLSKSAHSYTAITSSINNQSNSSTNPSQSDMVQNIIRLIQQNIDPITKSSERYPFFSQYLQNSIKNKNNKNILNRLSFAKALQELKNYQYQYNLKIRGYMKSIADLYKDIDVNNTEINLESQESGLGGQQLQGQIINHQHHHQQQQQNIQSFRNGNKSYIISQDHLLFNNNNNEANEHISSSLTSQCHLNHINNSLQLVKKPLSHGINSNIIQQKQQQNLQGFNNILNAQSYKSQNYISNNSNYNSIHKNLNPKTIQEEYNSNGKPIYYRKSDGNNHIQHQKNSYGKKGMSSSWVNNNNNNFNSNNSNNYSRYPVTNIHNIQPPPQLNYYHINNLNVNLSSSQNPNQRQIKYIKNVGNAGINSARDNNIGNSVQFYQDFQPHQQLNFNSNFHQNQRYIPMLGSNMNNINFEDSGKKKLIKSQSTQPKIVISSKPQQNYNHQHQNQGINYFNKQIFLDKTKNQNITENFNPKFNLNLNLNLNIVDNMKNAYPNRANFIYHSNNGQNTNDKNSIKKESSSIPINAQNKSNLINSLSAYAVSQGVMYELDQQIAKDLEDFMKNT